MQVNKPDQGVFKGFGRLHDQMMTTRRIFPRLRNTTELRVSPHQSVDYQTSNQHFKVRERYTKPFKHRPRDSLQLSNLQTISTISETKSQFRKYPNCRPPSLFRQNQHGTGIFENEERTGEMGVRDRSNCKEAFTGLTGIPKKMNISYKFDRNQKWDPINSIRSCRNSFAFEDYSPANCNRYRSHNPSPPPGQVYNIISGRTIE